MTRRLTATERLERMLAIVPFVAARPAGASIDELCERFDVSRDELLACLDTVFMVGVHPYTPDALIDVVIDSDTVEIRMSDWFRRPLRLTSDQRLALLIARRTFHAVPGADVDGPLLRALDKVAASMSSTDPTISLEFDDADESDLGRLRAAIDAGRSVGFEYFSFGRNSHDDRLVDPWRLQLDRGHWYLEGRCLDAGERRVFRVDRIERVRLEGTATDVPDSLEPFEAFPSDWSGRSVTLDLAPTARWVAAQYPSSSVEERADGVVRVVLPVTTEVWLERLLLRLGRDATIVDATDGLREVGGTAARRLLERYEN